MGLPHWTPSGKCSTPLESRSMSKASRRILALSLLTLTLFFATGCKKTRSHISGFFSRFHHRKSASQPNAPDYAGDISDLVDDGNLSILRWPNYSDYQSYVKAFYDDRNYELAWSRDYKPTPQAVAFIDAFTHADAK